ncbi:MAG: gliding motility-associated ABC transporter substrate-binding protein GldG [Bacteroidia bacterium]|nr:gliding motility-associated ABC transporter substrate-binding protein GldG [Bacteroidia bacterium]
MKKKQLYIDLSVGILIILLVNVISNKISTRFDLTKENRFTLSDASKNLISELDDIVYVKVFLEGDLPSGFKRLRNSIEETLNEYRDISNGNLEYEFINPSESTDKKVRNSIFNQLVEKGIQPTNLHYKNEGGTSQKIIFPGALVYYKGKELPVQFLKSKMGENSETMLNNSVETVEFELANALRKLAKTFRPKIAFTSGHGELNGVSVEDIKLTLKETYDVEEVNLQENLPNKLMDFAAVIIAKPTQKFNEKDKFKIDNYVMHGGKVLWLIDALHASMDSLRDGNPYLAMNYELNLEDQLFIYGARINPDMINDLKCTPIPIITGMVGDQPQQMLLPWMFFPLVSSNSTHPIVNNLEAVQCEFVNTIDTVGKNSSIKKTFLLNTSQYTKILKSPVRIHLDMLRNEPDQKQFNKPYKPVAVLLEGKFPSVFTKRLDERTKKMLDSLKIEFKTESTPTKMIVISDGDIIKNDFRSSDGLPYPLGFDRFTNKTFGNKNFILNCIDYLCDDSGVIGIRSKEITVRLLDKLRIEKERTTWQVINIIIPLVFLGLFGVFYNYRRKKAFV